MDIPLHPAVVAEITRGREFVEQLTTARRHLEGLRVHVTCPDGDNEIVFGGDAMLMAATFTDDLFDRYPGTQLRELLLTMCEEGFQQVCEKVTAQVTGLMEQR
jgi:hypothetical protein